MNTDTRTDGLEDLDAYCFVLQAKAVNEAAFSKAGDKANEYWGLQLLIDGVVKDVRAVTDIPTAREEAYEVASCSLAGAISLLAAYNDQDVDDVLLMAVEALLRMAKKRVDDDHQRWVNGQRLAA